MNSKVYKRVFIFIKMHALIITLVGFIGLFVFRDESVAFFMRSFLGCAFFVGYKGQNQQASDLQQAGQVSFQGVKIIWEKWKLQRKNM